MCVGALAVMCVGALAEMCVGSTGSECFAPLDPSIAAAWRGRPLRETVSELIRSTRPILLLSMPIDNGSFHCHPPRQITATVPDKFAASLLYKSLPASQTNSLPPCHTSSSRYPADMQVAPIQITATLPYKPLPPHATTTFLGTNVC